VDLQNKEFLGSVFNLITTSFTAAYDEICFVNLMDLSHIKMC